MRVLVTGATGGLGRNAVEFLEARGVEVHATGRNAAIGRELSRAARFTAADLATLPPDDLTRMLEGVDVVWHCAALSSPWGRPEQFEAGNVLATRNMLEASAKAGVMRFVHISTPAIYFDYTHRHDVDESFRASTPANEYVRTKAMAEDLVQRSGEEHPALWTVILRPRAIFGPHDRTLLPRLSQLMKTTGGRLPLPRGGRAVIDMTYVENVLHAMWLASTKAGLPTGLAFNISNAEPAPVASVIERLYVREMGLALKVRDIPYRALDLAARGLERLSAMTGKEPSLTRYSVGVLSFDMTLSLRKAATLMGYAPAVTLDEGIRRTAHWLKTHG
jgi:nucleoside-diphosphate-sugar epimerase